MTKSLILNHPKQLEVYKSKARVKLLNWGRRCGKTTFLVDNTCTHFQSRKRVVWYAGPTRLDAKQIFLEALLEECSRLKWKMKVNYSELRVERLRSASVCYLKSAQKPRSFRGRGIDELMLDEFSEYDKAQEILEAARPALSDRRGSMIISATPKGFNLFYQLCQKAKVQEGWFYSEAKTIDSPLFKTPEGMAEIESASKDLDEKSFKQEYEASFETFSGRVYYSFDRKENHSDQEFIKGEKIYIGQDFNRSPIQGVLYHVINGRSYAFGEISINEFDTERLCEYVSNKYPESEIIFRPDASGKKMTTNASKSDLDIIKSHGNKLGKFKVEARQSNPRIIDRINAVNRTFQKKTHFVNTRLCPILTNELETISFIEGSSIIDTHSNKIGHITDGMGYHIFYQHPIIEQNKKLIIGTQEWI